LSLIPLAHPLSAKEQSTYFLQCCEAIPVCPDAKKLPHMLDPGGAAANAAKFGCKMIAPGTELSWDGNETVNLDVMIPHARITLKGGTAGYVAANLLKHSLSQTRQGAQHDPASDKFVTGDDALLCLSPFKLTEAMKAGADTTWLKQLGCVRAKGDLAIILIEREPAFDTEPWKVRLVDAGLNRLGQRMGFPMARRI
jgi:hypothetical protein